MTLTSGVLPELRLNRQESLYKIGTQFVSLLQSRFTMIGSIHSGYKRYQEKSSTSKKVNLLKTSTRSFWSFYVRVDFQEVGHFSQYPYQLMRFDFSSFFLNDEERLAFSRDVFCFQELCLHEMFFSVQAVCFVSKSII